MMQTKRFTHVLAALATVMVVAVGTLGLGADTSPAKADTSDDGEAGSACRNAGHHGVFSSTSNLQECSVGFYACIRDDSGFNASISGLPPGSMGIIFQPWGANWYLTGGNNGYVENVCNRRAGSSGLIAMIPTDGRTGLIDARRPGLDVRSLPFDQQLTLIQDFCGGRCRAEYFAYHAKFLLGDGNPQQLWVSDQNNLRRDQFEFVALTYYATPGSIFFDRGKLSSGGGVVETQQGAPMNANGYMYDMVNTIRTEEHDEWYETTQGMVREQGMHSGVELALNIIRVFIL